jgi:WD40 repeat protein
LWDLQGRILQHFVGHHDAVSAVAFSPDGALILTGAEDGELILWTKDGIELQRMKDHDEAIASVVFSGDGQHFLSSSRDRTASLWDTGGRQIMRTPEHSFQIAAIAFGKDDETVLTVDVNGGFTKWEFSGQTIQYVNMGTGRIFGLAFSPNGRWIMAHCEEDRTVLWNIDRQMTERMYITPDKREGENLHFSADSEHIYLIKFNGTVEEWDIWGDKRIYRLATTQERWAGAFSPDGEWLAKANDDGSVGLWKLRKQEQIPLAGHHAPVLSAAVSTDGKFIVSGDAAGNILLWNTDGELLQSFRNEAGAQVQALAFRPDSHSFLAGTVGGRINEWNVEGEWITTYSFPNEEEGIVWALDVSADGQQLLVACMRQRAELLQLDNRERRSFTGHLFDIRSVSFSPDGRRVAMVGGDGITRQYDLAGELLSESVNDSLSHAIKTLYSPDGQQVLTGYYDGYAILWDQQGRPVDTLDEHRLAVWDAAFSPDGEWIATASLDRTINIWDRNGELQLTLEGHSEPVRTLEFFHDPTSGELRLLTAGDDQTLKIWDLSGREIISMGGHQGGIEAVAFSPDGTRLLTGSEDGNIKLWDRGGAQLQTIKAHDRPVKFVAFSPTADRMLSGSLDNTVKLWDAGGHLMYTFDKHEFGIRTACFSPDGQQILTGDGTDTLRLWQPDGTPVRSFVPPFHLAKAVFSPDGQQIAAVGGAGEVIVWNRQGQKIWSASPRMGALNSVVFAPDGRSLLLGARDGRIYLLDETGTIQLQLAAHDKEVTAAAFVPECRNGTYAAGELIVTAGDDGRLKLWDLHGNEIQNIQAHKPAVQAMACSPDGALIFTGSKDHNGKLWTSIACFFSEYHELTYAQHQAYGLPFDYRQTRNPGLVLEYGNRYLKDQYQPHLLANMDTARIIMEYLEEEFGPAYRPYLSIPYQKSGQFHFISGKFSEAIRTYETALKMDPDYAPGKVKLATAMIYSGNWEGALAIYNARQGQEWPRRWSANYHNWDQAFYDDLKNVSSELLAQDPELVQRAKDYLMGVMSER